MKIYSVGPETERYFKRLDAQLFSVSKLQNELAKNIEAIINGVVISAII